MIDRQTVSLFIILVLLAGPLRAQQFPYARQGLDEREAAAHLLGRFTYGPRPGEVERVAEMGLERWLDTQLSGRLPDPRVQELLGAMPALALSNDQILKTYPRPGEVLRMAVEAGIVERGEVKENRELRRKVLDYARSKGYRPMRELLGALLGQKLVRAVHSENQLQEVLTDFWYNHFYVSLADNQCRPFVLPYERDAIRPNALGGFRALLGATAKHRAMLLYLDNALSSADERAQTLGDRRAREAIQRRKQPGINENYARELLELHTLGVDGGYTQQDVVEVARAFTGWTVVPERAAFRRRLAQAENRGMGVIRQADFLFLPFIHDAGSKRILGAEFPAGGGMEEGERVLDMLSRHPSTARRIAYKFAVRFHSDQPPESLVKRLADTFTRSRGDTREMVRALARSPEFWSPQARAAKIKSPLELTASAVRVLDGDIRPTRELYDWLSKMGQPLYAYQAPTGFPDRADAWINSGTLLNRMNFALSLAAGQVDGIRVHPERLKTSGNPSPQVLLREYARAVLPGRELDETLKDLAPAVADPDYVRKLSEKAAAAAGADHPAFEEKDASTVRPLPVAPDQHSRILGILLGSPQFQRR
ncbi:MAG: DUF1800 domain-containing protein [Armatimonadetes bacterium]|nr:DUF1800 domain-containing protein [Armatimonadota bacterium]